MLLMKRILIFLLVFLIIPAVYAQCNSTQIDINSALKEKLMDIKWIGNSTSDKIINYRQNNLFDSIDELINISGIGNTKLNDIKTEGLACVDGADIIQQTSSNISNTNKITKLIKNTSSAIQTTEQILKQDNGPVQSTSLTPIKLNPQNIKTEEKKNIPYAIYGLIGFCILLAVLYIVKIKRRTRKNEFR